MKKLFIYLLKKYSRNEKDRVEILRVLDEQVQNEYTEQTGFGNVYNFFIEFVIASSFINAMIVKNEAMSLGMLRSGIGVSYDDALEHIKDNQRKK
jgi:hypothetical protein